MTQSAYCLFETSLGVCGLAWGESPDPHLPFAVTAFQLPEATVELTEARISQLCGGGKRHEYCAYAATLVDRVKLHAGGKLQDFRDVAVDLGGVGHFVRKVCEAARQIPVGQTVTYAELAAALGEPGAARAVGRALGKNPIPLIIPCHRVLAAHGKPGGFSAYGGRATKARLLAIEGVPVNLCLELSAGA